MTNTAVAAADTAVAQSDDERPLEMAVTSVQSLLAKLVKFDLL